jgi:hypothetical protein
MNLSINAFNEMPIFRGRHNVGSNPLEEKVLVGNGPGGTPVYVTQPYAEAFNGCVNTGSGKGGVPRHTVPPVIQKAPEGKVFAGNGPGGNPKFVNK